MAFKRPSQKASLYSLVANCSKYEILNPGSDPKCPGIKDGNEKGKGDALVTCDMHDLDQSPKLRVCLSFLLCLAHKEATCFLKQCQDQGRDSKGMGDPSSNCGRLFFSKGAGMTCLGIFHHSVGPGQPRIKLFRVLQAMWPQCFPGDGAIWHFPRGL